MPKETKPEKTNKFFECNECGEIYETFQELGGHKKSAHPKAKQPEAEVGDALGIQETFKQTLIDAAIPSKKAEGITRIYFRQNTRDIPVLDDLLKQTGVPQFSRAQAIRDWAGSQGLSIPEDLMSELETERQDIEKVKKIGKDEAEQSQSVFDSNFMKKSFKDMVEMQQMAAMFNLWSKMANQPAGTEPQEYNKVQQQIAQMQQQFMQMQGKKSTQMPYMDSKGELKTMDVSGSMDPMAFMMFLMMQQNRDKPDATAEIIKLQELRKALGADEGKGSKDINDLRMEFVKSQASADKKTIEEKAKFQEWMNEFKHALETSKIETVFNSKLDKIQEQLKDAQARGDLSTELVKYQELKKALLVFAETEGMKKSEGSVGGVNWTELISKGLGTMDNYFQAQANRPMQMLPVKEMPMTDEELKKAIEEQERAKYPEYDHENDFVGVKWRPGMDINPSEPSNIDKNADKRNPEGPAGSNEPK